MKRGDVVMAFIPYIEGGATKRRPVAIIQADLFNGRLLDTLEATITSNISLAGPSNRFAIDPATPDGARTGLDHPSVVRCDRLFTIPKRGVGRLLGHLSATDLSRLDVCLKAALGLP
jgi:mRNA interferase MazF